MNAAKRRGVGVYIFSADGSRVLLSQRGPKARHEQYKWEGSGGQLEPGETYEQAAHREIMEELGITIELSDIIAEFDTVVDSNGDTWEARIYSATTNDAPRSTEPDKVVGFGWFSKPEVAKLSLADYAIKDLQQFGWL